MKIEIIDVKAVNSNYITSNFPSIQDKQDEAEDETLVLLCGASKIIRGSLVTCIKTYGHIGSHQSIEGYTWEETA